MNGSDRSIRVLLVVIVFLLGANLLVNMNGRSPAAYAAGIPDTGAQIQAVVDQVSELNKKVEKVDDFLEGGHLSVTVQESKTEK